MTLFTALGLLLIALLFPLWAGPLGRALAGKILAASNRYRVAHVVVKGNRALTEAKILELAQIPAAAALFHVPVRQVQQRIETHPWIKSARVRRRVPDTIEIRISEREPVAAVRGNDLFMLTADSVAVAPLTANWQWDLPLLTPPHAVTLHAGSVVKDEETLALLHEILVLRSVSREAWQNLSEVYYAGGQMHATLSQPAVELNLGRGASELAWHGALTLLAQNQDGVRTRCRSMDLRVPGKIVVSMSTPVGQEQITG